MVNARNLKLDKVEAAYGPFPPLLLRFNGSIAALVDFVNENTPEIQLSETTARSYRDRYDYFRPNKDHVIGEAIQGRDRWLYNQLLRDLKLIRSQTHIPPLVHRRTPDTEDLAMVLSDLHFGKKTEQGGKVVFDIDIARQNLAKLIENARYLTETYIMPMHKLDGFNIFLVGDILDGELVYETQAYNLEFPVREQLKMALESLMPLFRWASETFNVVRIFTAYGNHGAQDHGAHQTSNWDLILYDMIELAIVGMENVEIQVSEDTYNIAEIRGHKYMLRHKIPSQLQTSSGRSKVGGWWSQHQFDVLITGHWHNARMDNFNGYPVFYNGNLFMTDEYTENLSYEGRPTQWLFGISDKRPTTLLWPVTLE